MARQRKVLEMSVKHRTNSEKNQKIYEENLVKTGRTDLEKISGLLDGPEARKEYKRVLKELQKIDIIGNLDRANLIAYANAWSMYIKAHKQMQDPDFTMLVDTPQGQRPNPLLKIASDAYDEMKIAADKVGISIDARLKAAHNKAAEQESELKESFGDF